MTTAKIVVFGANGNIGSQVVSALIDRNVAVRAVVRSEEKGAALKAAGAELAVADVSQPNTLAAALEGAQRVFLLMAFVPDQVTPVTNVVEAAKAAGVETIVKLSAFGADPSAPLAIAQQHGKADQIVEKSGLGYTILRPTFFQDNLLNFHAHTIQEQGVFYGASHGGAAPHVSSRDIAEVGAAILTAPERHDGKTYVLTGPQALTDAQVANIASKALERKVEYVDIPGEKMAESMRSQGAPDWMVESLVGLENVKAQGWAEEVTPVVSDILGRPGETYESFLMRHRSRLA